MTYDNFLKLLDEFEELESFNKKMQFANQYFQRIGSGSGRIVYDIDGTKVFKLAKNSKGVAQNDAEINIGSYPDTHHIVTKIFESDNNGSWIIAEKAKKVNEARIKQLTGIPSLFELFMFLKNHENTIKGSRNIFGQNEETAEFLRNNEFAIDLEDIMGNYSISAGDLGRASTYGEVIRDSKPTIVLTDYGLTDEVYDTHYSPKRKQRYQMYEMFNCADGNDDILSDMPPQDAIDTRRGMWAQMPYNVGDGGGVINEGFISFVLARDKYPKKLPSAPYVLDEFHNVVNNIKEVLKHVPEKKKFYNNLLALQEVLIENKLYDRDPLLKEDYEINEITNPSRQAVKPFTLEDRNYASELASAFAKKINLGSEPIYLDGGSNGHAFTINDNVLLKITADKSEADAAGRLINEQPKYIAKIYSFYKIIDTIKQLAFFGILQENVKDKPITEFRNYMHIIDTIEPAGFNYVDILMMMRKKSPAEVDAVAKHLISDKPELQITAEDRESAYDFVVDLVTIQEELYKYGIKSDDYGNEKNLGYQNGVLKFFDVGGYRAHEPTMMAQDIIYLPEDGSALYSTDNAMGQDNFPTHNNTDNSPSIQNDINANTNIEEDLEYNHVDDATKDQYLMSERKLSSMEGSSTVEIKKKCRLGGLGNTSAQCNWGDINAVDIKPLKESVENTEKYYRAVEKNMGKTVEFEPEGFYEAIDDNGDPIWKYDTFWVSETPEVAASKSVGGAVMGLYSMFMQYRKNPQIFYIYEINEKPDVDISHWDYGDFYHLKEVRYRRPVQGKYLGKVTITDDFKKRINAFYEMNSLEAYDEPDEETREVFDDTNYDQYLGNVKSLVHEEVNADEMHSDITAIRSVLNGKRGVAFTEINKSIAQKLEKKKIGVIPIRMTSINTMFAIIFTDKVKAYLLYEIAKKNNGYLSDKTPDEAREIGKLLDYKPSDIEQHIRNKYNKKPPILPDRSPDDFDDLAEETSIDFWDLNEENFPAFKKDIQQDLTTHRLDKKFIRNYQDGDHTYSVFAVNGDQVRDSGFIEWVDGGNHWVAGRVGA